MCQVLTLGPHSKRDAFVFNAANLRAKKKHLADLPPSLPCLAPKGSISIHMKLTRENINSLSNFGGFNSAQLTLLGASDKRKGWLSKLIGNEVSDDDWQKLIELKGAKKQAQLEIVPERRQFSNTEKKPENPTVLAVKQQFDRLVQCLEAGENVAAQDHAKRIVELLQLPATHPRHRGQA